MEECYFSIKIFNVYIQLTKTKIFQIVYKDQENQWRTKIILRGIR